ncbi:sensor domain-containing protein [Candidatus Colwellia aromaticivorans]|uniref:sensor domain-containing protein n=1 Tax=Candidatus Colwellia aromaticivorans TaxID=2267621 RepID=UPI001FEA8061|nr:bifunctional diguanylate cyclase/phosphodiesterase [Candidatus Colwellia aromaticivorans]
MNDPLHHLLDAVDAIAVQGYDENRQVVYWNKGSEILYGYTSKEALGRKLEDLIIPEQIKKSVIAGIKNWLSNGVEIPSGELLLRRKDGKNIFVHSNHVKFTNQYNQKQMYCIDINLSDLKHIEAQAKLKEHMLAATFEVIPDLFFLMEVDGTIIDYHASNKVNLYASPEDFIGKSMTDMLPSEVADKFKSNIVKVITQEGVISFEYDLVMPQGVVYFEARITYLANNKQIIAIIRDITEQHQAAESIKKHAYYDTLTGLPNRFLALDRLSQMLTEAERNNEKTAVLFLDLDDFKKVNDSLGHEVGDKLLIESATRLKKIVRKEDTVGRLGGDEFIFLLRGLSDELSALSIAENLLRTFRNPFKIDGRELILTLSIGIAMFPENGKDTSELLRNADAAMYKAKSLGRNTYSFFTKEMNVNMLRRLEIEEQMRGALERGEFDVYYQPQIDTTNKQIIGAEALLRWYNPALGNVTPDEFIPIAAHMGLIVPIGQFVLKRALSFLSTWQTKQQNSLRIAVNLSPRQFRDPLLFDFIERSLIKANVSADKLELEITEGVLMIGQTYIDEALIKLHKLGVKLSMDDFGTGYSSLSYLRQYAFDILKIDRSFITDITSNKADYDLVKATIAMAQSLGLKVIAEGVKTKEQFELLNQLKCDYIQGYYFSKPITAKQLLNFSVTF